MITDFKFVQYENYSFTTCSGLAHLVDAGSVKLNSKYTQTTKQTNKHTHTQIGALKLMLKKHKFWQSLRAYKIITYTKNWNEKTF